MDTKRNRKNAAGKKGSSAGSALILAVVLTSLLAMVGVLFVLAARVEKVSTSAIADNRQLNSAVEAVIARISDELAMDVPGVRLDPVTKLPIEEYYDYPDPCNAWLATLEPYDTNPDPLVYECRWGQISDVNGYLGARGWASRDIPIPAAPAEYVVIDDHRPILLDQITGELIDQPADPDGDGVADSKWIELQDITSSRGWPIYGAIRIIDNGAMLNANTAFKFDPTETDANLIDGSTLAQINLMALAKQPGESSPTLEQAADLLAARNPLGLPGYEQDVVWHYGEPSGMYTPFDISDELELRYRYLVNHGDIETPLEVLGAPARPWGFREYGFRTPVETGGELIQWYPTACALQGLDPNYAYRHIATTYNMDRIITPDGGRMINVNRIYDLNDVDVLFGAIASSGVSSLTAIQMAVNIKDYIDADSEVTPFGRQPALYYGFESPCVYISELAIRYVDANDPNTLYDKSYAIELYKPYDEDEGPLGWKLSIDNSDVAGNVSDVNRVFNWSGTGQFQVTYWKNPSAWFFDVNDPNNPNDPNEPSDPNDPNDPNSSDPNTNVFRISRGYTAFAAGSVVMLMRPVSGAPGGYVIVDAVRLPSWFSEQGLSGTRSYQRDIKLHKCIKRIWPDNASEYDSLTQTLGKKNDDEDIGLDDPYPIQAHPADAPLRNIGEIGMVFRRPAYYTVGDDPCSLGIIGYVPQTEERLRIDFNSPVFQPLLDYLTVFDPGNDGINNDGDYVADANGMLVNLIDENVLSETPEWKIAGRININTAPWYVIAQLPWMTDEIAQAVVAYRDKLKLVPGTVDYSLGRELGMWDRVSGAAVREEPGFASTAELVNVTHDLWGLGGARYDWAYDIRHYLRNDAGDPEGDWKGFPDLTTPSRTEGDGAADDLEERDLIFARLSNLVTVRSDVFSAYILVRIGVNGPQKRVVAILDRSNVYPDGKGGFIGRVKIRAVHPVPDPR
ncbi:MAG TPA: hypothetical protein VMX13_11650 [Sedimentisphaerales bacterium]|nr:hypothetical protein [Sedimentisphaerales bacterium]